MTPTSPDPTITQALDPGERLLWSGQPRRGVRLRTADWLLIPFTLLWCGFAIFWEVGVVRQGAPFFFMLWGIPFVCVGLFMVVGRFFLDAYSRARTFYAVTNERVLLISGLFSQQTKSLPLRALADLSLTQRGDGSGTITFGPGLALNGFFPASAWPGAGRYGPPAFDLIERAKEVYDLIRQAQRTPPGPA